MIKHFAHTLRIVVTVLNTIGFSGGGGFGGVWLN